MSELSTALDASSNSGPIPAISPTGSPITSDRLTKLEIRNYRGVRGTLELNLPMGENLLVYGENGAGKSSLYHALRIFLEAPDSHVKDLVTGKTRLVQVIDHRHRFTPDEPEIRFQFGTSSFQWSGTVNDTKKDSVRRVNQGKGFLDYKSLLEVHYLRFDEGIEIDIFPLLIRRLLPYYTYPNRGQNLTYQDGWRRIQTLVRTPWFGAKEKYFREELATFNDALEKAVYDLGQRATAILGEFDDNFAAGFHFEKAIFKARPKRIEGPRVLVRPAFRKQQIQDYAGFFNEARLSALSICLFFAALKDSPATGLRILALDDILIGLDMTNRVKVLDLVHKHFVDWQILVFTYSKAWFERLKERVKEASWAAPWQSIVLWEEWHAGETSPRVVADGSGDLLQMAERHLQRKDYAAAAVYARSALEALCHRVCAKASLHVVHVEQQKERKLEHYLEVIDNRLAGLADDQRRNEALRLIGRLRQARAFVLNRKSHFDVEEEDTLSGEVGAAIQVVKDMTTFLASQSWKHAQFKDGRILSATDQTIILLAGARKLAATHQAEDALRSLASAHELAWEAYGLREKVCMPLGQPRSAKSIWEAALEQTKLDAGTDTRLKAARPYLFGNVEIGNFYAEQFERAAKLLDELARL